CMYIYLDAFVHRRAFRMEYRLRRADGAYRWILDQGVPRFAPDDRFEGYIGSCIDITEMKEASGEMRQLNIELRERPGGREGLLREIHHRVKNNLQLISSMLSLQGRFLDGKARTFIEEGRARVHAMALAHDKLFSVNSLTVVAFAGYARDLVRSVSHAA